MVNRMRAQLVTAAGSAAFLITASAWSHHSISRHYHRGESVTVEGVVVEFVLRNPHSQIRMEVSDDAGSAAIWTLEMDDAEDLVEQGIVADTFSAGDIVVVTGNPARDGSKAMFVRELRRPADGLDYFDD